MAKDKQSVEDTVDDLQEEDGVQIIAPIIVDLGKQRRKRIKALKRGRGRLMDDVSDVLDEVQIQLGDDLEGKTLMPIILLYEKKRKRRKRNRIFPFSM